jgi:hypothetical protein
MLFGANGIVRPETFFAMNVALACSYTAGLLLLEWKHDAQRFVGSLPVRRDAIVKARYVGAMGAAALGTLLYAAYGHVLLSLGGDRLNRRWPEEPGWESPEGLLVFFLSALLLSAAFLPFYFRSGLARGTWLFTATLVPALVAATLLVRGWASNIGASSTQPLPRRALASVFETLGTGPAIALVLGAAAALGWVSLLLSIRFFERRDL